MKIFAMLLLLTFAGCKQIRPSADILEMRIAFGYKDARPARFVGDRYERLGLIERLTRICHSKDKVCGFERSPIDADLLEKRIVRKNAPDLMVRIWITSSAAGPDDDTNRRNPYQGELSKLSRWNFMTGLQTTAVTVYIGHSRDGGGPDFTYPRLTANGHVDYAYYKHATPGLKDMRTSIQTPLLVLASCASTQHFTRKKLNLPPRTKLVTASELLYYSDALEIVQGAVENLTDGHLTAATRRARP